MCNFMCFFDAILDLFVSNSFVNMTSLPKLIIHECDGSASLTCHQFVKTIISIELMIILTGFINFIYSFHIINVLDNLSYFVFCSSLFSFIENKAVNYFM